MLLFLLDVSLGLWLTKRYSLKISAFMPYLDELTHLIILRKDSKERLVPKPYPPIRKKLLKRHKVTSETLLTVHSTRNDQLLHDAACGAEGLR